MSDKQKAKSTADIQAIDSTIHPYSPNTQEFSESKFGVIVFKYTLPQIICFLCEQLQMLFSLQTQLRYLSIAHIKVAPEYYALIDILTAQLSNSWSYVFANQLETAEADNNVDHRKLLLSVSFIITPVVSLLLEVVFIVVATFLCKYFEIPEAFVIPFSIEVGVSLVINSFNSVEIMRYLSEQRMVIYMGSSLLESLLQMMLEQVLYSISIDKGSVSNNLVSVISYIIVGVVMALVNFFPAFGMTLYGFVVRNVTELRFGDIVRNIKEQIKTMFKQLALCFSKFIIDITLPLSIVFSSKFIISSFKDDTLEFEAIMDLFIYYFPMGLVKIVSVAFGRTYFIIGPVIKKTHLFSYFQSIMYQSIVYSLIISGVFLLVLYFLRVEIIEFLIPADLSVQYIDYFEGKIGHFKQSILFAGILNMLNIIPEISSCYLFLADRSYLNYIIAICKVVLVIILIVTMARKIGDKGNFLNAVAIGDACGICLSFLIIVYIVLEYFLVDKKRNANAVTEKKTK